MRHGRWALAWLACTLVSFGVFARPRTTPVHPDEVYWIGSAYYHHLAFERFDWTHADWKLQPARENPPVAKYVIGLGLALQGQHIVTREMLACFHLMFIAPGAWGEGEERAKRVAVVGDVTPAQCRQVQGGPGVSRPRALPYLARHVMIGCAALTSLLLFAFGTSVANAATGLIASQLILLHPHMIHAYNRTMSDPVALLFGTAAAFATWELYAALGRQPTADGRRVLARALLTGVLLGLACGAKMNSLVVVFLFCGAMLVAAMGAWREGNRQRVKLVLIGASSSLALALALFIAINPAILNNQLEGLIAVVREPQLNTAIQARVMFPEYLDTLPEKLTAVSHVAGGPLLFGVVAALSLTATLKWRTAGMSFVLAWLVLAVVCVTVWIPFDWSRYTLPILPSFTLLAANVVVEGLRRVRHAPGWY